MKRISQNKFASSLFSCLGVAACVAFSSCGKKDNDKFESADEFEEFLQDKAQKEQVTFESDDLTKFANNNYKTASKKTFQFTEEIKKQIAGEDPDNEDDELSDQEQPDQSKPEQPNPDQSKPEQPNPDQSKPGTEQSRPTTVDLSGTTAITNEEKLSELIKRAKDQHIGMKIDDKRFDLNVFSDLYSWIYQNASDTNGLVDPKNLTLDHVRTIMRNSKFSEVTTDTNEKNFGINQEVSNTWNQENEIYPYTFKATNEDSGNNKLECLCYNGLLKCWAQADDLGFSENSFENGVLKKEDHNIVINQMNHKATLNKIVENLVKYLGN